MCTTLYPRVCLPLPDPLQVCADREGEMARDALVVHVQPRPMFEDYNVRFIVEFEGDFSSFVNSTREKTRCVVDGFSWTRLQD